MPTYQYACTECGHGFDIVQSFSEDSLTVCPECGGRLRKVFNAVGVVFKGSGFYRTDSRGKQSSESGPSTTSDSPSTSTTTTTKPADSSTSNGSTTKDSKPSTPKKSESAKA